MIEVEGPDGVIVEFPDDAPREIMANAMRKRFGGGQSQTPAADPAAQPPSTMEGIGMGAMDPVMGLRQLVANIDKSLGVTEAVNRYLPFTKDIGIKPNADAINKTVAARETDYQGRREAAGQTGMDWGRLGGNVIGTIPMALVAPAPASIGGAIGLGAATGAAGSAAMPVENAGEDFYLQKAKQALTGATLGAATGPLAYGIGRAIAPKISDQARQLADEGVKMTPGQLLGGGYKKVEDALTSVPILGDQIAAAQRRSLETFNEAAINRALKPIGDKVAKGTPVGREMVDDAFNKVSAQYNQLLPGLRVAPDQQLVTDLAAVVNNPALTPEAQKTFARVLADKVLSRFQSGQPIDGKMFKVVESDLGKLGANYGKSAIASERELGAAFDGTKTALRDLLVRSNPWAADKLKTINTAYAHLARIRGASASQAATDGVFTPAQLSAAVRAGDQSVGKGAYARGDALMQDLSDAGRAVLPSSVPDSGTPRRALTAMGALAAGGSAGVVNPALAAAGVGGLSLYTPAGQVMLRALLAAPRPAALRGAGNAIAASGPFLAPALAAGME